MDKIAEKIKNKEMRADDPTDETPGEFYGYYFETKAELLSLLQSVAEEQIEEMNFVRHENGNRYVDRDKVLQIINQ